LRRNTQSRCTVASELRIVFSNISAEDHQLNNVVFLNQTLFEEMSDPSKSNIKINKKLENSKGDL